MALMMLGGFVFKLKTAPFQEKQRSTAQRWASNNRVGRRPAYQYTGKGDDSMTLSGAIYHEVSGYVDNLDKLRAMADEGEPYLMVDDTGNVLGWWVIENVDETDSEFFPDGSPRKAEFTIDLTRVDKPETFGGSFASLF